MADAAELRRRAGEVIEALRQGWLRLDGGTVYDLNQAADAHRAMESRKTHGKVFLKQDVTVAP